MPFSLRNATAFGFSPRLRADIVLNNLVGRALLTGKVTVLSDGTPWRPLAHAEDIAGAVLAALDAPAEVVRARAFNVGTEKNNRTVAEIAEAVVEAVPGSVLEITGEAGNDPRSYRVDFSRARKELGFEAQWTIPDGAEQLATEYRARGLTQDAFDNRFTRLAVLARRQQAGELDASMRVAPAADRRVVPPRRNALTACGSASGRPLVHLVVQGVGQLQGRPARSRTSTAGCRRRPTGRRGWSGRPRCGWPGTGRAAARSPGPR